jgi:adenylate cyclase class IV
MDPVASLGSFIEVEYAGDAQTADEAADAQQHAAVSEIDVKLGDRDRDRDRDRDLRGYPYMLLNRR